MKKSIEKESIKRDGDDDSDSSSSESDEKTTMKRLTAKVTQKTDVTTAIRKSDRSVATSSMCTFDILWSTIALLFPKH